MEGLSLQIADKWAVLDEGVSISVEENSPIWGEGNSFSFPFELDVESNRHIIGNSDQLTGESVYKVLDGQPAVLYVMGVPLYYGKISLDDEVEIADGRVEVTLISGNLTFDEMIDGMNCQDVPLKDEIVVGEIMSKFKYYLKEKSTDELSERKVVTSEVSDSLMVMEVDGVSTINVSAPYPQKPYCNTRICYPIPQKPENTANSQIKFKEGSDPFEKHKKGKYLVLDAERPYSGMCFYVLYFLEQLFSYLKIDFDMSVLRNMDDMCRLAFYSTKCLFDTSDEYLYDTLDYVNNTAGASWWIAKGVEHRIDYPIFAFTLFKGAKAFDQMILHLYKKRCVATSKNFPNVDVSKVIQAIETGFGVRFLFSRNYDACKVFFIKDILMQEDTPRNIFAEVISQYKIENSIDTLCLKYNGEEDNTSFSYLDWKDPVMITDYKDLQSKVNMYNKSLYVDSNTGNAYRVKIDEDATSEDETYPALFEVGEFNEVIYGNNTSEDKTETIEIGFTPIILNDVNAKQMRDITNGRSNTQTSESENNNYQELAVLLDVEMKYPEVTPWKKVGALVRLDNREEVEVEVGHAYYTLQYFDETSTDQSIEKLREKNKKRREEGNGWIPFIVPLGYENISPISSIDTGLTLGIMRGPGNESGVEEYDENYDGEGNSKYTQTVANYAFTSDTCDNYGSEYDYNGKEDGGVGGDGRFSLKLKAEKPVGDNGSYQKLPSKYAKRGLFDKFYAEYSYFVVNRKIVRLTLRMELADLASIDWTKRYKIGDYVGFVNKYNYTVDNTGMSDVTLEMYYL